MLKCMERKGIWTRISAKNSVLLKNKNKMQEKSSYEIHYQSGGKEHR